MKESQVFLPTTVECKICGVVNWGDNLGNVYFAMAQLHQNGCNYGFSSGFRFRTQHGVYIMNGELDRTGHITKHN